MSSRSLRRALRERQEKELGEEEGINHHSIAEQIEDDQVDASVLILQQSNPFDIVGTTIVLHVFDSCVVADLHCRRGY